MPKIFVKYIRIYASINQGIFGSDMGQELIWTDDKLLLIGSLNTVKHNNSFTKIAFENVVCNMSVFCLGRNVLKQQWVLQLRNWPHQCNITGWYNLSRS